MDLFDLALDFLKDHKLIAAIVAIVFLILLIRNFWFLIKLLVALALGLVVVSLVFSFIGKATKKKKDLLNEGESLRMERVRSSTAQLPQHRQSSRLVTSVDDPLSPSRSTAVTQAFQDPRAGGDK